MDKVTAVLPCRKGSTRLGFDKQLSNFAGTTLLDIKVNQLLNAKHIDNIILSTDDYNIFYWLKILENAHTIALVESSMSNLVEQFSFDCNKILFRKIDNYFMKLPVMKNKWKIV